MKNREFFVRLQLESTDTEYIDFNKELRNQSILESNPRTTYLGKVFIKDDLDDEKNTEIGYIRFSEYNLSMLNEFSYSFLFDIFDDISVEQGELLDAIYDKRTNQLNDEYVGEDFDSRFFYVDSLYIEPEYRNLGAGTYIMKNLERIIAYLLNTNNSIYLVLKAFPTEKPVEEMADFKEKQKRLFGFYRRCGFAKIRNEDFMYK